MTGFGVRERWTVYVYFRKIRNQRSTAVAAPRRKLRIKPLRV
jgi:hypothetical protein